MLYFLLPCPLQEMAAALPVGVLQQLVELQPQLFVVDARRVADAVGLGKRINMVMQAVFFQSSGVLPMDKVMQQTWPEAVSIA
jgi:pyruvate-ferredoxin/flavodoxin oxidoreductase